jgi:hypothetical protein
VPGTPLGALIGAVAFSGSIIAWAKLDGRMDKRFTFPGQQSSTSCSRSSPGGRRCRRVAWRTLASA